MTVGAEVVGIAAVAVVLAQGLTELIKLLISKYVPKKEIVDLHKNCGLTEKEHGWLGTLHSLHHRYDVDGVPIWYVPRSWSETQKEIVDNLRDLAETQNKTLSLLDRIERRIDT